MPRRELFRDGFDESVQAHEFFKVDLPEILAEPYIQTDGFRVLPRRLDQRPLGAAAVRPVNVADHFYRFVLDALAERELVLPAEILHEAE